MTTDIAEGDKMAGMDADEERKIEQRKKGGKEGEREGERDDW